MNCHEINEILNSKRLDEITADLLSAIESHLIDCEACREEILRVTNLKNSLKPSDDLSDYPIPMELMRQKIEIRLKENQPVRTFGSKLRYAAFLIPVILLAVYFGVNNTDKIETLTHSYELAISGVDLDIAENDHQICELFYDVGLQMASVDILGCDSTCNLLIFDLQSEAEAKLAIQIIENISDRDISSEIIPIPAI